MSIHTVFEDGDTMDIGGWVNSGLFRRKPRIQGLLFKQECSMTIDGGRFGIVRCIGITRREMEFAQKKGSSELISHLAKVGIYPHTFTTRNSAI
jgi:hypothetical protein